MKEKPFTMQSWDDLRLELVKMNPRSKLYKLIRTELRRRGNWKNAPRGVNKVTRT